MHKNAAEALAPDGRSLFFVIFQKRAIKLQPRADDDRRAKRLAAAADAFCGEAPQTGLAHKLTLRERILFLIVSAFPNRFSRFSKKGCV